LSTYTVACYIIDVETVKGSGYVVLLLRYRLNKFNIGGVSMARELTASEMLAVQEKYLVREIDQHKRDVIRNEAKVTEDEELLVRNQNTCIYCGEYVYNYSNENRMGAHIESKHLD